MYLSGAHMQYVIQVEPCLFLPKNDPQNNYRPGDGGLAAEVWCVCEQDKASEESQDPAKQWIEIEHSTMHIKEYDSDHDLHKSEDEAEEQMTKIKKTDEEKGKDESCASQIKEADSQQQQPEEAQ